MKPVLLLITLFWGLPLAWARDFGIYQHGTVVRMRMGDCALSPHGFMASVGGPRGQMTADTCPEYTLVTDKVVFVIVGKSSNQLIPLADVVDFRLCRSELAVRVDDAKHEIKLGIKEMILRSEWDRVQKHIEEQLKMSVRPTDDAIRQAQN
jgi:hypothetical protein